MVRLYTRASLALFALSLFVAAAWAGLRVDDAQAITNCDTNSAGNDSAELAMLDLINGARAAAGIAPLGISPTLNRMAAWKSEDPSASPPTFDHVDSLGRAPFERAQDCGYSTGAAENIAYGYSSAQATFTAWMGSTGHRANILGAQYKVVGIGRSGGAWTVNFGWVDDSGAPPPPPPTQTSPPTNTPRPQPTATPIATQPPVTADTSSPSSPPANLAAPNPTATRVPVKNTSLPAGTRAMTKGLNFITYSGPDQAVENALGALGSNVEWVYTWDGKRWLRYVPGAPSYLNSLTTLRSGVAYFIEMRAEASWGY